RPAKYTFTKSDYVAYRKQCQAILQHPCGRAALMDGGYYWRLAMGLVKWEDVLKGPSGLSLNMDEMVVIDDKVHGLLIDDRLTVKEANALCGTYKVPTEKGNQVASQSWFMPVNVYKNCAIDLGRW
ncbi:hypothetical protein CPB83DRAFT_727222, partial [Crepidotus variabilis]